MPSIFAVPSAPVSFGEKLGASGTFDTLFRDGMSLVEATATYLDGAGREQARQLGRLAALTYASESMRLTTRLMQIASWLLLQRAVNEGEITADDAAADKGRTRAAWEMLPVTAAQEASALPQQLKALVQSCNALQERIQRMDRVINDLPPLSDVGPSLLDAQRARLQQAFQN